MSVLVNKSTRLICQGFTGSEVSFHSERAIAHGTQMIGGRSDTAGVQMMIKALKG